MWQPRLRLLLVTFWVGSLWTIGYVAAPTLFATLADRVLAGTIAGSLFAVEAWISIVCAVGLCALHMTQSAKQSPTQRDRTGLILVLAMLACSLIGHFGLQPLMAGLRAGAEGGVLLGDAKARFGLLHGAASALYLFNSLLAALLMFRTGETVGDLVPKSAA